MGGVPCLEPASLLSILSGFPNLQGASVASVDEAHCCDTSRSLRILIGRHSKVTSSKCGCKPALVSWTLYRKDVSHNTAIEMKMYVFLITCQTGGLRTLIRILTLERIKRT